MAGVTIADKHDRAMEAAEAGDKALAAGFGALAHAYYVAALDLERAAAEAERTQPSRGIMLRSAAWLAMRAGDHREAARLARLGLADSPVERLTHELREVLAAAEALTPPP